MAKTTKKKTAPKPQTRSMILAKQAQEAYKFENLVSDLIIKKLEEYINSTNIVKLFDSIIREASLEEFGIAKVEDLRDFRLIEDLTGLLADLECFYSHSFEESGDFKTILNNTIQFCENESIWSLKGPETVKKIKTFIQDQLRAYDNEIRLSIIEDLRSDHGGHPVIEELLNKLK